MFAVLSMFSVLSMLSVLSVLSMLSVFSVLSMLSVFPVLSMLSVYLLMLRLMLRLMLLLLMLRLMLMYVLMLRLMLLLLMLRLMLMLLMCLLLMLKLQSKYSVYTEHYDVLIESIFCKFIMVSFLIIIAYRFSSPMRKIHMRELKSEPHGLRVSTIHHHHILSQKYSHICCYLNMLLLQPEALYSFQWDRLYNVFPQDKYSYLK